MTHIYEVYRGEKVILQAFVQNLAGDLIDQPTDWPKIQILKVETGSVTEVLAQTAMNEDVDGEYYYEWTAPDTASAAGFYKVRYEAKIDGITYYGYDVVRIKSREDRYDGWGK